MIPGEGALGYARRGRQVLPLHTPTADGCSCDDGPDCASPGKHPRVTWPPDKHADPTQVARWWRLWPDANVGIVTGSVSDLLVIDVDPRHGGSESLAELYRRYQLADTATVRTGSGGLHLYHRHPGVTIPPSAGKLLPGIDIRADRGLVVAPPSLHASGERYRWIGASAQLAPCPRWLVVALQPPPPKPRRQVTVTGDHGRYAQAALESAARNIAAAAPGQVHDTLWREAYGIGRLVAGGLIDEDTGRQALLAALPATIRSMRAAEKTVAAKFAYARTRPRTVAS